MPVTMTLLVGGGICQCVGCFTMCHAASECRRFYVVTEITYFWGQVTHMFLNKLRGQASASFRREKLINLESPKLF